jgi:hypothetical protein
VRTVGLVFAIDENATERWFDAECGKEIRGDAGSEDQLWLAAGVEDEAVAAVAGKRLERLRRSLPVAQVGVGNLRHIHLRILFARFADEEEFAGIAVRERAKERRVDDGEDRGVGADAEGKRQDDDRGEPRIAKHEAKGVAQILAEHRHLEADSCEGDCASGNPGWFLGKSREGLSLAESGVP